MKWARGDALDNETFDFDNLGRVITHTRSIDGQTYTVTTNDFDELGRLDSMVNAYGETVSYSYDREGADSLTAGADNLVKAALFNERGQMTSLEYRTTGTSTFATYNYYGSADNYRLQTMAVQTGSTNHLVMGYAYDNVGNISQIEDLPSIGSTNPDDTQTFTYDHLNRLDTAVGDHDTNSYDYDHDYQYDAFGNILAVDETEGSTIYPRDYESDMVQPHAVDTVTDAEFLDSFPSINGSDWATTANVTATTLGGDNVVKLAGQANWSTAFTRVPGYVLEDDMVMQTEFYIQDSGGGGKEEGGSSGTRGGNCSGDSQRLELRPSLPFLQ